VRVHPDGHILLHDEKAARALRRRRRGLPEAELLHCEDELLHLGVRRVRVLNGFNPHTEVAFAICDKPLGDSNGISQMQMYNNKTHFLKSCVAIAKASAHWQMGQRIFLM
jgi:hypothetical protein